MKLKLFALILLAFLAISCTSIAPEDQIPQARTETNQQPVPSAAEDNSNHQMMHEHSANDPHMKMTALRSAQAGDEKRAAEIADKARKAIEKYKDYRAALRDGFEILLPQVPQKMYHFNKLENYMEAESRFNPERPTSLLYEKNGNDYRLIGVMYTAPAGMTEDELNERVPLSVTEWHQHINICLPKGGDIFKGLIDQGDRFGIEGSISTREECEKAGGQFLPRLLGWMVHLYPYEKTPEQMWSVERQMNPSDLSHTH